MLIIWLESMFSCSFLLIIIKCLDSDMSLDIYRVVVLITMGPGILKLSSNTNISHTHTHGQQCQIIEF